MGEGEPVKPPRKAWKIRTTDGSISISTVIKDPFGKDPHPRATAVRMAVKRHQKIARTRNLLGSDPQIRLAWVERIDVPSWSTHGTFQSRLEYNSTDGCHDSTCSGSPCVGGVKNPRVECPWYKANSIY